MTAQGYGHIFVPEQLEDDVERLLAPPAKVTGGLDWLTSYLAETERQTGRDPGDLRAPKSWNTVSAVDDWPLDRLPAVLIVAAGSDGDPRRDEEGAYTEAWRLEVAVVTSARTRREARRLAGAHAMAVRAAILQQLPGHSDQVLGVLAGPYRADVLPTQAPDRTDTVAAGQVAFHIIVPDVVTDTVSVTAPPAPPALPTDPAPDDPTVATDGARITTSIV